MIHKTDAGQAASPASCVYWEIFRRLERLLTQLFLRTEVRLRSDRRQKLDNHVRKTAIFFPNNPAWAVPHVIHILDHEEVRSLVIAMPDLSRAVIDEHEGLTRWIRTARQVLHGENGDPKHDLSQILFTNYVFFSTLATFYS